MSSVRRRTQGLSRAAVVAAAVELLDAGGEGALTFRALAGRLETGSGAIHWHVADKAQLLAASAEHVMSGVVARAVAAVPDGAGGAGGEPVNVGAVGDVVREGRVVRAVAAGTFDAIRAHPWVGAQLAREPWQPAALEIFEGLGAHLGGMGVPEQVGFDHASALMTQVLGVAGQYAAAAQLLAGTTDRATHLAAVAAGWDDLDPTRWPFLRQVAPRMREHDDRDQFLAGVDLLLAGITAATTATRAGAG